MLVFGGKKSKILHITNTSQSTYYHTLGKANTPTALSSPNWFGLLVPLHIKESQTEEEKQLTFLKSTMLLRPFIHLILSSSYNRIGICISA